MAEEPGIRRLETDLKGWSWALPAAALHRLDALAQLADTDRLASGRPLPAKHRLRILAGLLDHLLPDGTEALQLETVETLDSRQREHLAHLIHHARAELRQRQAEAPSTLLGFPPGARATWANLLDRGWIPMPPGSIAIRKD